MSRCEDTAIQLFQHTTSRMESQSGTQTWRREPGCTGRVVEVPSPPEDGAWNTTDSIGPLPRCPTTSSRPAPNKRETRLELATTCLEGSLSHDEKSLTAPGADPRRQYTTSAGDCHGTCRELGPRNDTRMAPESRGASRDQRGLSHPSSQRQVQHQRAPVSRYTQHVLMSVLPTARAEVRRHLLAHSSAFAGHGARGNAPVFSACREPASPTP